MNSKGKHGCGWAHKGKSEENEIREVYEEQILVVLNLSEDSMTLSLSITARLSDLVLMNRLSQKGCYVTSEAKS